MFGQAKEHHTHVRRSLASSARTSNYTEAVSLNIQKWNWEVTAAYKAGHVPHWAFGR